MYNIYLNFHNKTTVPVNWRDGKDTIYQLINQFNSINGPFVVILLPDSFAVAAANKFSSSESFPIVWQQP